MNSVLIFLFYFNEDTDTYAGLIAKNKSLSKLAIKKELYHGVTKRRGLDDRVQGQDVSLGVVPVLNVTNGGLQIVSDRRSRSHDNRSFVLLSGTNFSDALNLRLLVLWLFKLSKLTTWVGLVGHTCPEA